MVFYLRKRAGGRLSILVADDREQSTAQAKSLTSLLAQAGVHLTKREQDILERCLPYCAIADSPRDQAKLEFAVPQDVRDAICADWRMNEETLRQVRHRALRKLMASSRETRECTR